MPEQLTRVSAFNGWWAKREDDFGRLVGDDYPSGSDDYPSGSKVRQYIRMAEAAPGAPMIVGCVSNSAMQIYVAAAARQMNVPAIIYTGRRLERSAATKYAASLGAEINETSNGYPNVVRKAARDRAALLGKVVKWDVMAALRDTMYQCQNIPASVDRIVVPTGSGMTCAAIMAGVAEYGIKARVYAVCVSNLAQAEDMIKSASALTQMKLPRLEIARVKMAYGKWVAALLPDGSVVDPYYAAKAMEHIEDGDCLWLTGLRPIAAMPDDCVLALDKLMRAGRNKRA